MNFVRKSLSRRKTGTGQISKAEMDIRDPAEISKRVSIMRTKIDAKELSLDEKLKARARTSIRRSGIQNINDFTREPVEWAS
mmetsp:Transcript_18658/g.30434  ORF Transcript_18658/g.30434 Transcript_18658/m.30434 type:complete len:82 (-) Transcript_18658:1991-2236(-)